MIDHLTVSARDLETSKALDASGIRKHSHPGCSGAFVIDPDEHLIEAVCHKPR